MTARAALMALVLGSAVVAQEKPKEEKAPPLGLLGELLLKARQTGEIERLDPPRWFRLQSKQGGDAVVAVRVVPSVDPPCLVVESVLSTLGQDPPSDMNTQVLLGPDGRMQGFRSALRSMGKGESRAEGKVVGKVLKLVIEEPGKGRREEERAWDPEAVPGLVLMFVVPMFHHLLDKDETPVVQFDESNAKLSPRRLVRARSDPKALGPALSTVTLTDTGERKTEQMVARCDPDGDIVEVRRDTATLTPLPHEEAEKLLQAEMMRPHIMPPSTHDGAEIPPDPPPPRPIPPAGQGG